VISRRAAREEIFDDDGDREAFLEILGRSLITFTGCAALSVIPTVPRLLSAGHYHLVVETKGIEQAQTKGPI